MTSRTDPNGGTYGFTYDPVGRLTSETDPAGGTIAFAYNPAGQRTSFTNPNGATRTWTYDQAGRVASHADELGRVTSYTHDPAGRQLSMTDPRGVTTNRTFDAAGQLLSETAGGESRAFAYDSGGRVTSFSDITGTTTLGWDPMGRLTSVTSAAGTVGYSYNTAGERVTMTQPEGTTTYSYDNNGHLTALTDWRNDTATFTVDPDGRMTAASLPNGVTTTWGYDGAGRLTSIAHTGPAGTIDTYNYTLDNNGNRTSVTSAEGTETYTLDPLNRITGATYPDGTSETFTYDPAGNRTSHTRVDGTTITYTHDPAGQLISDSSGTTYTYDPAGNLTSTSTGDTYTYNPWGQLTSAAIYGVTTTASFDATGTRVSVDGDTQLWDRTGYGTLISTSQGNNYVHAPGIGVLRDDTNWLHTDAIGSVRPRPRRPPSANVLPTPPDQNRTVMQPTAAAHDPSGSRARDAQQDEAANQVCLLRRKLAWHIRSECRSNPSRHHRAATADLWSPRDVHVCGHARWLRRLPRPLGRRLGYLWGMRLG